MGRKRIREEKTRDRIGEEVDFEKCPECSSHPDCFAWMEGKCTALNAAGGKYCVFFCPEQMALNEARESYRRLKESGRSDLIRKYIKPLTALGLLDDEIEEYDMKASELDAFKHTDFKALMQQTPGFTR